jgi:hypothetical protein
MDSLINAADGEAALGPDTSVADATVAEENTVMVASDGLPCLLYVNDVSYSTACDRSTQYCLDKCMGGGQWVGGCVALPDKNDGGIGDAGGDGSICDQLVVAQCGSIANVDDNCRCTEDDAGGFRIDLNLVSCAACYGSPPARPERLRTRGTVTATSTA